ncbi:MAG: AAA-like domain-containing protein [Chloroflexota bacterium]
MRFFNTAGPVNPQDHYCLPPLERFDLDEILRLIDQKKYFVLHAPRQVGKTTFLLALRDYLNQQGDYRCLYFNVEIAQTARDDVAQAMQYIWSEIVEWARITLQDDFPASLQPQTLRDYGGSFLHVLLTRWAEQSPRPMILLIDEIDSLVGDSLISVLRQLRAGYTRRPEHFPQSIILCGVRDVRDYRLRSSEGKELVTGGSAFNIKAKSLRLGDFAREEVETLYQQHTAETGQVFTAEALEWMWTLAQGQPWLVNALAYETCFELKAGRDRCQPITAAMVAEAKEALILRRETHLDQLTDKLREERVRQVISPILQGGTIDEATQRDNIQYVMDLGLVKRGPEGLQIANSLYREIIPRELTVITQINLESQYRVAWYVQPDGRLDVPGLLTAFQQFFREHSEHWLQRFEYQEAGPQLLMQAFLQRIVNGGGRVEREYGLGRGRTDLLVWWPYGGGVGVQKAVIELKLLHKSLDATIEEGLAQTFAYMDRCQAAEGHLVIFDRRSGRSWEDKIFQRVEPYQNTLITVWGM